MRAIMLAVILTSLLIIPSGYSLLSNTVYNCTDGSLFFNKTIVTDSDYIEIVENETCPSGCALNNIQCDSPLNVEKGAIAVNAGIFMVLAILFMFLSQKLEPVNKKYYMMKYLYFSLFFIYTILSVGLLGGMFIFGQDSVQSLSWSGWIILIWTFVITILAMFFTELKNYVDALHKAAGG